MDVLTQYVIPFLLVLTVLVFVHELGHFLVARRNGVKVEVFSVGFGAELWGFNDRYGTRWRLSAVPLGGYVKMFGEGDVITGVDDVEERPMTEAEKKVSFHHKRLFQRAAIVAAGPAANFIFAVLVLWVVNAGIGVPTVLPIVGEVIDDTAAEDAGIQPGDRILSVDGRETPLFEDLSAIVSVNAGNRLAFEIQRGGEVITIYATPRPWGGLEAADHASTENSGDKGSDKGSDKGVDKGGDTGKDVERNEEDGVDKPQVRGLLGVRPDISVMPTERTGIFEGLTLSLQQTYALTANILDGLREMFSGERSAKELGGVIMIAEVSGDAAQGGLMSMMRFLAILSINLGLINLFPVPVLDGGHLAFYFAEALRGKPLSPQVQEYSFRFGVVLVLLLMLFATWNDFERLFERFGLS